MQWYKIHFSPSQVELAEKVYNALQKKIMDYALDRKTLRQLAVFVSPEEPDDGQQTYYLSPVMASVSPEVVSLSEAAPCDPPSKKSDESLSVLISWDDDNAAWAILRERH